MDHHGKQSLNPTVASLANRPVVVVVVVASLARAVVVVTMMMMVGIGV